MTYELRTNSQGMLRLVPYYNSPFEEWVLVHIKDLVSSPPPPGTLLVALGRSRFLGNEGEPLKSIWCEEPITDAGTNSRFGIVGVTRNQYGTPVGGCDVLCFLTATDVLVSQVTSDVNTGHFNVPTPFFPDTHYLVAQKVGTPPINGTTINTIVAT